MDQDEKLEKKIADFQALAKENPKVDVNMLMMNALATQKQNLVSPKMRKWAYLISLGLPPLGLLFALKFYFGEEDDARHTGKVCIVLTIIAVLMFWFTTQLLLSGSGTSVKQIEQIKPSDIYQLSQ